MSGDWRTKPEVRTYTHIWYSVLEDLAQEHLGREISVVVDLEADNDSWYVINIETELKWSEFMDMNPTYQAIVDLQDKGVLSSEHPILIWVMW